MADKLPPIYLKLFSGKLDFCDDEDPEFVVAYPREADAIVEHCGLPIVKYEPAVPRCKTCPMFRTPNPPVAYGWKCARLAEEFHVPQDGSGYCSNHPEAKP